MAAHIYNALEPLGLYLTPTNWADWQMGKAESRLPTPPEFEDYPAPYDSFDWSYTQFHQQIGLGIYDVQSIWSATTLLGFVKAFCFTEQACECGIEILSPDNYGKGYASRALALFITYLKTQYPSLQNVNALIHPQNTRSLRLFEKLGFESEGQVSEDEPWMIFEKMSLKL